MPIIAGIDGYPSGWLCLTKDLSTGVVQARILAGSSAVPALIVYPPTSAQS